MFNHVVLLNWTAGVSDETIAAVTQGFSELPQKIEEIKAYSYGKNIGLEGANFEYALVAKFEDQAAYQRYAVHPAHLQFMAELTEPIVDSYGAVQYLD